uniref:Uncharacterized protein n=1 Tax=Plectus sambesii TaxID=2011161 RepID=A0A914X3N2_9BILA
MSSSLTAVQILLLLTAVVVRIQAMAEVTGETKAPATANQPKVAIEARGSCDWGMCGASCAAQGCGTDHCCPSRYDPSCNCVRKVCVCTKCCGSGCGC